MDLRQLELLCALAREEHFGRAAKNCNISQPAFSARIRQLENELGVPIVKRERSYQGLTTEGELVVTIAQRILAEARTLKQSLSQMSKGLEGHLRIGAIPSAMPVMSLIKNPFCKSHPNITVSLLSLSSAEIQLGLEKFDLEVGVTYLSKELSTNVESHELYREEYSLIHKADGPLKDRETISWKEAAKLPLTLLTRDMQYRRLIDKTFEEQGCLVTPHTQTNSITQLIHETRFGTTSSIVPIGLIHAFRSLVGLVTIPLSAPNVVNKIGMVIAKREPSSPIAKEFFKHTRRLDIEKLLREGRKDTYAT